MNKKKICLLLVLLLLIGGVVAWTSLRAKESPEFTQVKQLQEKLLNDKSLPKSERNEGWREVKQKWSSLSESEREILAAQHEKRKKDQIDRFFALETEEERVALLDEVIDEFRKEKEGKEEDKKTQGSKGKGKRGGKGKPSDPEAMRAELRNYLDSKSADDRVKEGIYYRALKERWAERYGHQRKKSR
jgi:hypothetical protein